MADLPEPLTPADSDLRGFDNLQLDVDLLPKSKLANYADAEAFRAAVLLWCEAWKQVPAASLPNDDLELRAIVGLQRDAATWERIKHDALSKFIKCSDGRLYHEILAEKANKAWEARLRYRERGKAGAKAKAKRALEDQQAHAKAGAKAHAEAQAKQVEGEGEVEGKVGSKSLPSASPPVCASAPYENPNLEVSEALDMYRQTAEAVGLPIPRGTDRQKKLIRARLKEHNLDGWRLGCEKIRGSPFLQGESSRNSWGGANLDWFAKRENFEKVIQGNYDKSGKNPNPDGPSSRYMGFLRRGQDSAQDGGDTGGEPVPHLRLAHGR